MSKKSAWEKAGENISKQWDRLVGNAQSAGKVVYNTAIPDDGRAARELIDVTKRAAQGGTDALRKYNTKKGK